MSEQTPDTSNGLSDGVEPSMEDILASIRKIIADDESNALPMDNTLKADAASSSSDNGVLAGLDELNLLEKNTDAVNNDMKTLDLDIVSDVEPSDSEIDSLLADMDMIDSEAISTPVDDEIMELAVDDMLDLEIPMEDDEFSALEDLVSADTDVMEVKTLETPLVDESSDDELSLMLDEMLNDEEDTSVEVDSLVETADFENLDLVVDPAEDLLEDELEVEEDLQADTVNTQSDMELVKSLMADLTGAPLHEDVNAEVDADTLDAVDIEEDAEIDIFEELGMDLVEADAEIDTDTGDVMDEILSLTFDDEMEIQAEALEAADIDIPLSLKDIAAQAEVDADAISGGKALAAVAALGAVAAATQIDEPSLDLELELEIETVEELSESAEIDDIDEVLSKLDEIVAITPETEIQTETPTDLNLDEETPQMPRAAKKDTIIDEVTETATAGAFASLNQVVEEKAVVAERGDRVGDLVMEALRPMLKDWLDSNLKGIVERAVTKEVKRISSGK